MPIYEYRCQQCGTTIETMQRMADAPLKHCDACGADALERLISQTSFVLKGSGWYVTDYKSRPSEAGGKSDPGSSSDAGSKSESPKAGAESAPKADAAPKAETSKPTAKSQA